MKEKELKNEIETTFKKHLFNLICTSSSKIEFNVKERVKKLTTALKNSIKQMLRCFDFICG